MNWPQNLFCCPVNAMSKKWRLIWLGKRDVDHLLRQMKLRDQSLRYSDIVNTCVCKLEGAWNGKGWKQYRVHLLHNSTKYVVEVDKSAMHQHILLHNYHLCTQILCIDPKYFRHENRTLTIWWCSRASKLVQENLVWWCSWAWELVLVHWARSHSWGSTLAAAQEWSLEGLSSFCPKTPQHSH